MTAAAGEPVALDVRPVLARGEEPFDMIMQAAARVEPGGTLLLTAPFEPVPLYGVLARRGFAHRTAPLEAGDFLVRFVHTGIVATQTVGEVYQRYPATARVFAHHGIDLCCGGARTLEFVAQAHKLDLPRLLAELQDASM